MSVIYNIKQLHINHKPINDIRITPIDFETSDPTIWKPDELITTKALQNLKFQKSDIPYDILFHNMIINDVYYFRGQQELFYGFDLEFEDNDVYINQNSELSMHNMTTLFLTEQFINIDTNEKFNLKGYRTSDFTFNTTSTIVTVIVSDNIDLTKLVNINFSNISTEFELIQQPLTPEQLKKIFVNVKYDTPIYDKNNEIISYAYENKLSNVMINKANLINISYGQVINNYLIPCYYEKLYGNLTFNNEHLIWNYQQKTNYTLEDMILNNTYYCNYAINIAKTPETNYLYREYYHNFIIRFSPSSLNQYALISKETGNVADNFISSPLTSSGETILKLPDNIIFITNYLTLCSNNTLIKHVIGESLTTTIFTVTLHTMKYDLTINDFYIAEYDLVSPMLNYSFNVADSNYTFTSLPTTATLMKSYIIEPAYLNEFFNTNLISNDSIIYKNGISIGTLSEHIIDNILMYINDEKSFSILFGQANFANNRIKIFDSKDHYYEKWLIWENNALTLISV